MSLNNTKLLFMLVNVEEHVFDAFSIRRETNFYFYGFRLGIVNNGVSKKKFFKRGCFY